MLEFVSVIGRRKFWRTKKAADAPLGKFPTVLPSPAVSTPTPPSPKSRRSSVSSVASDPDDTQCLAHMVCMSMYTGPMPLSHRECAEVFSSETRLLTVGLLASHLPCGYDLVGIKLCATHSEVYAKLRGVVICADPNCFKEGQSNSKGSFFCSDHLVKTLAPPKPSPKVKFEEG